LIRIIILSGAALINGFGSIVGVAYSILSAKMSCMKGWSLLCMASIDWTINQYLIWLIFNFIPFQRFLPPGNWIITCRITRFATIWTAHFLLYNSYFLTWATKNPHSFQWLVTSFDAPCNAVLFSYVSDLWTLFSMETKEYFKFFPSTIYGQSCLK
jgi:hypothetical protein